MALCPGLPGWAGTRKVKPIWILLEQETVSGSGISWAIRKSAPCSRQITTPAPHHSVFLQAWCPSCHPANSVKALKASAKSRWYQLIAAGPAVSSSRAAADAGSATLSADVGSWTHSHYSPHDAPRWVIEPSRWLLLEREMLFRRLFVLRHLCCSSAATSRRHCMFQSSYSSP